MHPAREPRPETEVVLSKEPAPRIYLAGPEVFLSDACEIAAAKRRICAAHGLVGVFPTDGAVTRDERSLRAWGLAISRANEQLIRTSDALIANATPFRGPSIDPGTAYEMGCMRMLGRPVLAYTNVVEDLELRTARWLGSGTRSRGAGPEREDRDGMLIEAFGLADNLMIEGATTDFAPGIVRVEAPFEERFRSLTGFELCVARAREVLDSLRA